MGIVTIAPSTDCQTVLQISSADKLISLLRAQYSNSTAQALRLIEPFQRGDRRIFYKMNKKLASENENYAKRSLSCLDE